MAKSGTTRVCAFAHKIKKNNTVELRNNTAGTNISNYFHFENAYVGWNIIVHINALFLSLRSPTMNPTSKAVLSIVASLLPLVFFGQMA